MTNFEYENTRYLDVVNDKDEIIDSKPRNEIHKSGLIHRQIYVWMFDTDKNIFFQKRGLHRPSAGQLDATVGGHVNKGEDYLVAAIRETKEETGISVSSDDLVFLKKLADISNTANDNPLGTVNNFFAHIYIYRKPIDEKMLKKEAGIPGAGFQKLSYDFLVNPDKQYVQLFHKFIFSKQLPEVLKYLK